MNEAGMVTVLALLHNYEEYGDEVWVHNGRIVQIVAGRKKKARGHSGRKGKAGMRRRN